MDDKCVIGYVCAFGNQSWCFKSTLTVSDWASWVQAVGSICAILASACVVWWQVRKQHRLAIDHATQASRRAEYRQLSGFTQVLAHAQSKLAEAAAAVGALDTAAMYANAGFKAADFDLIDDALAHADPSLLETAGLDLAFRAARKQFQLGLEVVKDAITYAHAGPGVATLLAARGKLIEQHQVLSAVHTSVLTERMNAVASEISRHS